MGPILGQYWLLPILVQHWVEILDQYPVLLGPDSLDVESSLFADDSCVFNLVKPKLYQKMYSEKLRKNTKWCDLWGFKISLEKNDCSGVFALKRSGYSIKHK